MKSDEKKYTPIDCGFYDEIEIAIMRGEGIEVTFLDDEGLIRVENLNLLDTNNSSEGEFVVTNELGPLRMDRILKLGEKTPPVECRL